MKFRPCIDLHSGVVKQIVGSTLTDVAADPSLSENFASELPASHYAAMVCVLGQEIKVLCFTYEH
jgi:phosphoribosylformimino-5-aminoimidazole carboxamide ribotide isomerase